MSLPSVGSREAREAVEAVEGRSGPSWSRGVSPLMCCSSSGACSMELQHEAAGAGAEGRRGKDVWLSSCCEVEGGRA